MHKTQIAGGVVLNAQRLICIVNQQDTSWSFPKGHVEAGEEQLTAAKREIFEETGIKDLTLLRKLGSYERFKISKDGRGEDNTKPRQITMYLFTTTQQKLQPQETGTPEARWVKREEVANLLTHPKDTEFFLRILPTIRDDDI
ncbi:NUDIX domain-containing protein [Candidatus Woesearchaeota archaeon]|nr:NUDIX domain-containing protein [Candidatus Woesearchaeota archaeon]